MYYECPMLCTQVLNGLDTSLSVLTETVGRDFDVVAVSFDPRETPALASGKKKAQVDRYKRPGRTAGWHFLTGEEASIKALTDAAGFHYVWDDKTQQFAHPSGIIVVDARRPAVALLLRDRVRVARREVRADRVVGRPDRQRHRSAAALLLPLRPGDRFVRVRGDGRGAARRRGHACCAGRLRLRVASARPPRRTDAGAGSSNVSGDGPLCYGLFGIPIFPEQASSFATDVDALYFFVVAVSALFALLVAVLVIVFGVKFHRRHEGEVGARIEGNLPMELLWSVIPTVISMVMFGWGASVFYHLRRPPDEAMHIYAVGKQWMWKFQHLEGQREINELHVPTGRADQDHHDVRGRDPQPLLPVVPAPRSTRFPAATPSSGSRRPSRARITSSAPNTAAPTTPA